MPSGAGSDAQSEVLAPGDSALRPDRIKAGVDSFRIESYRGGDLVHASTLVRSISRDRSSGAETLVFAQAYRTSQGMTYDTSWVNAKTLAPVRYSADVYGTLQQLQFTALGASGTIRVKDSAPRPLRLEAVRPFFNAVTLDLVYASISWEPGLRFELAAVNPPPRNVMTIHLRVVGPDVVERSAGGSVPAWLLEYRLGPLQQRLWLDRGTGELLRIGSAQAGSSFYKYRADLKPPA